VLARFRPGGRSEAAFTVVYDLAVDDRHRHVDPADRVRLLPRRRVGDGEIGALAGLDRAEPVLVEARVRRAPGVRAQGLGHREPLGRGRRVDGVVDAE